MEENLVKEKKEEVLTIKVLQPILMHQNMSKYSKEPGDFRYESGDIVTDVNKKYKTRLSKFPEFIEFL
jgi:hypothetical protein